MWQFVLAIGLILVCSMGLIYLEDPGKTTFKERVKRFLKKK